MLLASVALPLALSLLASYGLNERSIATDLQRVAEASARRASGILDDGRALLADLDQQTAGDCGQPDMAALRLAGFADLHYREAGLIRSGQLVCTSFERFDPPWSLPLDYLRRPAVYTDGAFELREPQPTRLGGRSLVAMWWQDRERLDYLNLLLDLDQFAELIESFQQIDGAVYLIDQAGRPPLRVAGSPLDDANPRQTGLQRGADGSLYVAAHASPYPFAVVARLSAAGVGSRWAQQARPAALLGVALTLAALWLLRRLFPRRDDLIDDLDRAIRRHELVLFFQPVVDGYTGSVLSAEALVRWQHPQRGLIYPDSFIELAERHGLIGAITERVLALAKDALERLPAGLRLAVNVPPGLLLGGQLSRLVDRVFGADGSLERITLELTERELVEYTDPRALEQLQSLAARGAKISLDDFGTGYSGLSHLRHLKPQQIKIDRSFIRAMGSEAVTAALVDAIVVMTETLGVDLVAEGVESAEQRQHLLFLGVQAQQGWLYARAMPLAELLTWLANAPIDHNPSRARAASAPG